LLFSSCCISDIPSTVDRGCPLKLYTGRLIVNPTFDEKAESRVYIVVAGTEIGITMVEEDRMWFLRTSSCAIEEAQGYITQLCQIQRNWSIMRKAQIALIVEEDAFLRRMRLESLPSKMETDGS
jgi:polyribonucleotide nucleotidyltransferase